MPRFWGIHSIIHIELETSHMIGKSLEYMVPIDDRLRSGDFVYLMRDREYLYGWGYIQTLQKPELTSSGLYRKIDVTLMNIRSGMADLQTQILNNAAFANYERQKDQNLSSLNDEQVRFLNGICQSFGSSPPNPEEARLEEDRGLPPLRPLFTSFVLGQRLQLDETRFDEFKTISSENVMARILDEVYGYVIGFLNLEDRRGVDYCRIFWGVTDTQRIVEGVKLNDSNRDQLRRDVSNKLAKIKPPLAPSAYYIELHNVCDTSGIAVQDLYVVEVGVGHGEQGAFYCSENDTFYLKQDGTNPPLKGQSLIAEIRRRLKDQLLKSLNEAQQ